MLTRAHKFVAFQLPTLLDAPVGRCLVISQLPFPSTMAWKEHYEQTKGNVDTRNDYYHSLGHWCHCKLPAPTLCQSQLPTTSPPPAPFPSPIESPPCMKHTAHQTDDRPSGHDYWLQGLPFFKVETDQTYYELAFCSDCTTHARTHGMAWHRPCLGSAIDEIPGAGHAPLSTYLSRAGTITSIVWGNVSSE